MSANEHEMAMACLPCRDKRSAVRERRRIRRLIAPLVKELRGMGAVCVKHPGLDCAENMLEAIDAATRAPKNARQR